MYYVPIRLNQQLLYIFIFNIPIFFDYAQFIGILAKKKYSFNGRLLQQ